MRSVRAFFASRYIRIFAEEKHLNIFHLFDTDADGTVDFQEVVMGIYKITDDLDSAARAAVAALLIYDEDGSKTLDYAEFTSFILELITAAGLTFNEAIFNFTQAAAEPDNITPEELSKRLAGMTVDVEVN